MNRSHDRRTISWQRGAVINTELQFFADSSGPHWPLQTHSLVICYVSLFWHGLWVFVYVWVGLTPPCTDPHLAFLFGVRNGKRLSVNPEAVPCLYSRGNSFIFLKLFAVWCIWLWVVLLLLNSFFMIFLTLLFPVSLFQALPLCLGVRGDTVKFTTYNSSIT